MATVTAEKLSNQGWYISPDGLNLITDNGNVKDVKVAVKNALDSDLKDIGATVLAEAISKGKIDNMVLQIQKIRNISAPKSNEDSQAAPRMLKLILTDGHAHSQAVEINSIPSLHHNKTVPGTKILVKAAPVVSGYIFLEPGNCTLLGGKVAALYEKWEVAKISGLSRGTGGADGPPAWVNFGQKIITTLEGQSFKSLETKQKEEKLNSEFDTQRQDAIAEAASGATKRVFGGGTKQSLQQSQDYNSRSYGTGDRNAERNRDRNNAGERNRDRNFTDKDRNNVEKEGNNRRNNKRGNREPKEAEDKPQRPSEKLSLFDFLENKLPVVDTPPVSTDRSYNFDNKKSSNYSSYQQGNYGNPIDKRPPRFNARDNPRQPNSQTYQDRSRNGPASNDFGGPQSNRPGNQNTFFENSGGRNNYNSVKSGQKNNFGGPRNNAGTDNNFGGPRNTTGVQNNFGGPRNNTAPENDFGGPKSNFGAPNNNFGGPNISFVGTKSNFSGSRDFGGPKDNFGGPKSNSKTSGFGGASNGDFGGPRNNSAKPQESGIYPNVSGKNNSYDSRKRESTEEVPNKNFASQNNSNRNQSTASENLVNQMEKMSLNSQFASRSFKQHLNLPGKAQTHIEPSDGESNWIWKKGDRCMAKYWEDGKYYNAIVMDITPKTCVVQFNGYGNVEEVLRLDCIPISEEGEERNPRVEDQQKKRPGGSKEFRRGDSRTYRPQNSAKLEKY